MKEIKQENFGLKWPDVLHLNAVLINLIAHKKNRGQWHTELNKSKSEFLYGDFWASSAYSRNEVKKTTFPLAGSLVEIWNPVKWGWSEIMCHVLQSGDRWPKIVDLVCLEALTYAIQLGKYFRKQKHDFVEKCGSLESKEVRELYRAEPVTTLTRMYFLHQNHSPVSLPCK